MGAIISSVVGIDLTAGGRPSDLAALDSDGGCAWFAQALTDDDLERQLEAWGATIVAIDSPLGLPAGLCCLEVTHPCVPTHPGPGRSAERALARRGIPCFWTTKRTIIKKMAYRGIALRERFEQAGYTVIEVYPYATKRILLGRDLPPKHRPDGQARLVTGIRELLPMIAWPDGWAPNHDQIDALFCALTARLYGLDQTESLGDSDEVPIVVPKADVMRQQ